jgi:hypothetical protein
VSGYLERLVGRARADATGLRPRPPSRFAPASLLEGNVEAAADVAAPGEHPLTPAPASPAATTPRLAALDTHGGVDARIPGDVPAVAPGADAGRGAAAEVPARPGQRSSGRPPTDAAAVVRREPPTDQRERVATRDRDERSAAAVPQSTPTRRSDAPQPARARTTAPTARRRETTPTARASGPTVDRRSGTSGVTEGGQDVLIEVSIGRVEIPAPHPIAPARPDRRPPARPPLDLSDYLKQRRAGR